MPFKPGQKPPKGAGRPPGVPNKKTVALQEIIERALGKSLPEAIFERLPDVKKEAQVNALLSLMDYIYPKRKAIDVTTLGQPVSFVPDDLRNKTDEEIFDEYKRLVSGPKR